MGTGSRNPRGSKAPSRAPIGRNPFGSGAREQSASLGSFAEVAGLGATLDALVTSGDAVILGRTSDGGALSITVLSDAGKQRAYPHSQEELDAAFAGLAAAYVDDD